jgi:hypothetical protein
MVARVAMALLLSLLCGEVAVAAPLTLPFDYSRGAIGVEVSVKKAPLFILLDTGVDPSVIDLGRADALGVKIDRSSGSEVSGVGSAKHAQGYDAVIDGLQIEGHKFPPLEAGASDLSAVSAAYGKKVDGVLGFSFLKDQIVLVDYATRRVSLLDSASDAMATARRCRTHFMMPMQLLKGFNWPLIPHFRLGKASAPMTLDTGSNGGISLYQGARALPGVQDALGGMSQSSSSGLRGSAPMMIYTFGATVGFGPFRLPAGQRVTLRSDKGSLDTRLGNVGNKLFAAMTPIMLLDYRDRQMTFFSGCQ